MNFLRALGKRTKEETSVKFFVRSVVLYGRENWTLERSERKRLEAFQTRIRRRMEHVKWSDKIKKCSCARNSGWRKDTAGTDKEEEKKLSGPLVKKELSAEGHSRRNGEGKKVRGRRYQMIDNFMINGLYEDTKRKAGKRIKWKRFSLQWKTYPWAKHCDWLIDWLIDWFVQKI